MLNFETIEQLNDWLLDHDSNLKDFELIPTQKLDEEKKHSCKCNNINETYTISDIDEKNIQVNIKSLTEQPKIKVLPLSESMDNKNIWYVNDFEFIENACSTSKIIYNDSTVLMNVCESDGETVVNLLTEINGKFKNMPFILNKSCNDNREHDIILFL